jgi:cytochrome c biogenesis protein CcdA
MKDRGLNRLLGILFTAGGLTILIYTSVQAMPLSERIFAIVVGSMGILWAIVQLMFLRSKATDIE